MNSYVYVITVFGDYVFVETHLFTVCFEDQMLFDVEYA